MVKIVIVLLVGFGLASIGCSRSETKSEKVAEPTPNSAMARRAEEQQLSMQRAMEARRKEAERANEGAQKQNSPMAVSPSPP